ncbi:MAG TPA: RteC domain-containing protein [Cyclobacteriaceae bacterium]|nr:RteC domain-containing protein [Cyclobacteriaceae bacterium]
MKAISQTDIKSFAEELLAGLNVQLELLANDSLDLIMMANKALQLIKPMIQELRNFVFTYEFIDIEEEIVFFKDIKPLFTSKYYFYNKLLSLKISEPYEPREPFKEYYAEQLKLLQEAVKENYEFHFYYLSGATYHDSVYFTRGNDNLASVEYDLKFSTGYDLLVAKILANQLIKEHLLNTMKELDNDFSKNCSSLSWTGTKASLIELIYSLHGVDAINNGNADIKQIATLFEGLFNIKLGNWYRHFQEIRLRKNGRTNFIDQMKKNLEERLDDFE